MNHSPQSDQSSIHSKIADYINTDLKGLKNINDRQNAAITKMSFLRPPEFQDLLTDINDEMNRRLNLLPFSINDDLPPKRNLSRKKMSKLNDQKFKNLLIDVFLAFNHRYPEIKGSNEIQSLISELATLVISLKTDLEYEQQVLRSIQAEESYRMKAIVYNKYIKRVFEANKVDPVVVCFMDKIFQNMKETSSTVEILKTPIEFIKATQDHFQKQKEQVQLEYEYHCENIKALLDEDIYEREIRSKLISKEMSAILQMLVCSNLNEKEELNIEPEINSIITNLEAIKTVMQNKDTQDEYFIIAENVLSVVEGLLVKLEKMGFRDEESMRKLVQEVKKLRKGLDEQLVGEIPTVIFNLANLVKSILYSMPVKN